MNTQVFEELRSEILKGLPEKVIEKAISDNEWFTEESIQSALNAICSEMLDGKTLERWIKDYKFRNDINIGVIMAGNIPLVGFFDMLAVLVSGAKCYVKPSSKDKALIEWCMETLRDKDPKIKLYEFNKTAHFDAVIATGSDNSNRYFVSEYGSVPLLMRGSRFSVAIIDDTITDSDIILLWDDIFTYYSLGCRNVSHIFIPKTFDMQKIIDCWKISGKDVGFIKYRNNYTYTKAEKMMNDEKFIDGGYFIFTERYPSIGALSDISFSRYDSMAELQKTIDSMDDKLQCVVSSGFNHPRNAFFGKAQHPTLTDYPDSKNVLKFLSEI